MRMTRQHFANDVSRRAARERGATSLQVLVILVPVIFGLMGFALDLGRLYLVRAELKTAANSMALAAATRLIGTDASTDAATTAGAQTIETATGFGNKYDFGGSTVGQTNGSLNSEVQSPTFFGAAADALGSGGGETSGSLAKYVRVTITGEAGLTFWRFLPLASAGKVNVIATAVAGVSAPLCQACSIEPLGVAALDATDGINFGFLPGTKYTLGYVCNGVNPNGPLPNTVGRLPYLILNHLDSNATVFPAEASQLLRIGVNGLLPSTDQTVACSRVGNTEQLWATATTANCTPGILSGAVTAMLCGIGLRFDSTPQGTCAGLADLDTIASLYPPDTTTDDFDDYASYTGTGRRVITIPIVDVLNASADMTVLGFRQFLLLPNSGAATINVADSNGRFAAMYVGSVKPLRQGSMSGCTQSAGPGKVVLHQ